MQTPLSLRAVQRAASRGLALLRRPEPLRLSEWAGRHFYLSPESSYVEGAWEAYPYQVAILDAIGNDDIREVVLLKSARVGATKMMLAGIAYFAHHKRRNQAIWQPVDDDAEQFAKTEVDPLLRDCAALREVFPHYQAKSKLNTMSFKQFTGAALHILGGKAAKNYRRLSLDVAYLDELDGFDRDIEFEGDPVTLAAKRIEGASFPKLVLASTPKLKGLSHVEARAQAAQRLFRFHVPCVHCGHEQHLEWGGRDADHGFKFGDGQPAAYLCAGCGALFDQADYLAVWEGGRWRDGEGVWIDPDGLFRAADGAVVEPPRSVAFHIWTAYSPMSTWEQIAREWREAQADPGKLKAFVNTTLGQSWEEGGEQIEPAGLAARLEDYDLEARPAGILTTTMGVDIQKDRIECELVGWGLGEESWGLDYRVLPGDTSRPEVWAEFAATVEELLPAVVGIDSGFRPDPVYQFAAKRRFVLALKGIAGGGIPISEDRDKRARRLRHVRRRSRGVIVHPVGVDQAKALIHSRLKITRAGPGYCHFPAAAAYDDEYFSQLCAEKLVQRYHRGRPRLEWVQTRPRNEALDVRVYALAALRIAGISLEALAAKRPQAAPQEAPQPVPIQPVRQPRPNFATSWKAPWARRW